MLLRPPAAARGARGLTPRTLTRWTVQHGLVRLGAARGARAGDPHARLIVDPAARADPFPTYEAVRGRDRLVRARFGLLTSDHEVAGQVLRSEDLRAGVDDAALPAVLGRLVRWSRDARALGPVEPPSLLVIEPPDHTRFRRLVSKVFTARRVEALRPRVEAVAAELLDDLERQGADGSVDLVPAYATLLPVTVIADLLGVPREERAALLRAGHRVAPSVDVGLPLRQYLDVDAGLREFQAWLGRHLDRLRREPGEDLLSQLVHLDDEGQRLTDVELRAVAGLLLVAGFETTVNLLGSGAALLLEHPDQLDLLRAEPARWPGAVEEVLRLEAPVQVTGRFAVRDTELAGQQLRRGELVIVYLAGANRDPQVFPDPARFDVTRANAREHLSFSAGRHFCLGAALARVEGEVGLRALVGRFPDLALAGPGRRRTTRVLRGWESLPVRLGAGRPAGTVSA